MDANDTSVSLSSGKTPLLSGVFCYIYALFMNANELNDMVQLYHDFKNSILHPSITVIHSFYEIAPTPGANHKMSLLLIVISKNILYLPCLW